MTSGWAPLHPREIASGQVHLGSWLMGATLRHGAWQVVLCCAGTFPSIGMGAVLGCGLGSQLCGAGCGSVCVCVCMCLCEGMCCVAWLPGNSYICIAWLLGHHTRDTAAGDGVYAALWELGMLVLSLGLLHQNGIAQPLLPPLHSSFCCPGLEYDKCAMLA